MLPEAVDVVEPITVGVVKAPFALLSSAMNLFLRKSLNHTI
jgi:hypothetical protein